MSRRANRSGRDRLAALGFVTITRDYYEVLGVSRKATLQDIKSAYRKAAVSFHPDRNPGDQQSEEKFKEAAEAYAVLSDPEKRQRYDRFGHQATRGAAGGFGAGGFDPTVFADFSDILGDLFGLGDVFGGARRRGRRGPTAGADLRYDLRISFRDAAFGIEPTLRIPRLETCDTCSGTGSRAGKAPESCRACGGRGQVAISQGFFTVARSCPQCHGAGSFVSDPCATCSGQGRVEREQSIQVTLPAGVDDGTRLRLPGEGEHGVRGGPPGDLYVVLHVEDDERLKRHGADVVSGIVIGYAQAVLGATVEVETLHGKSPLEIPPGTAFGEVFRLRGEGIPRLRGRGRGDHLVEVAIAIPDPGQLSEEHLELLRRLAVFEGQQVHEDRSVLDRVRDFFGSQDT